MVEPAEHAVLWPWDILHHMWLNDKLLNWIYDPEDMAVAKVEAASIQVRIRCFKLIYGGIVAFRSYSKYRRIRGTFRASSAKLRNIGPMFRTFPSFRSSN